MAIALFMFLSLYHITETLIKTLKTVFTSGSSDDDSGITYTTKEPHELSLCSVSVCKDRSAAKDEVQMILV